MVAAATPDYYWPDGVDLAVTVGYLALIFGVIAAGYICMALDISRLFSIPAAGPGVNQPLSG